MGASKDEQKRLKKKEKAERRRMEREAKARSKVIRRAITFLILVLIVGGAGYLVYSAVASGPRIGPLNSAHEHADWAMYVNGKAIALNASKYQLKSDYVHMEGGTQTIHMHAINVPLGYFLDQIGMKITPTSLTVDGVVYQNEGNKKIRIFVKGQENFEYDRYILKKLDKILVVYGGDGDEQINAYIKTVPDEAKKLDQPQPARGG